MSLAKRNKAVVVGTPVIVDVSLRGWVAPLSLGLRPGGGGSIKVETTMTRITYADSDPQHATPQDPNADGVALKWIEHASSPFAADTELFRYGPCAAVRFTANVANGSVDILS